MAYDMMALIREVYRQARRHRIQPPCVTRLVKLLYLADLEWRRRGNGPVSELTWRFLHYGPYANELAEPLNHPDMEVLEEGERKARRFDFDPDELEATSAELPEDLQSLTSQLVRQWGDANIYSLLDYVYFDTEPMENARRGDTLDFSNLARPVGIPKTAFDERRIEELRNQLRQRVRQLNLSRGGIRVPAVDMESELAWSDDDFRDSRLPNGTLIRF